MKHKFLFPVIIAIFSIIMYCSCKDTITGNQVDSVIIPSSNVSFSQYILPVFEVHCTSCHGNGTNDGGVDLTSWVGATNPGEVVKGYPDNSKLVWTIEGKPGISPMPPLDSPYKPLNTNQVDGVKTWIKEGAKNN